MASGIYITKQFVSPYPDTSNESLGTSPNRAFINFDDLPSQFVVVVAGNDANGFGGQSGTIRVRVGGDYDDVDGDLAMEESYVAGAFAVYAVYATVTNIWSGWQLVKVTAQGGTFMQRASWSFVPVI